MSLPCVSSPHHPSVTRSPLTQISYYISYSTCACVQKLQEPRSFILPEGVFKDHSTLVHRDNIWNVCRQEIKYQWTRGDWRNGSGWENGGETRSLLGLRRQASEPPRDKHDGSDWAQQTQTAAALHYARRASNLTETYNYGQASQKETGKIKQINSHAFSAYKSRTCKFFLKILFIYF